MPYTPGTDLGGMQAALGGIRFNAVDTIGVAWRLKAEDGLLGWDSSEVRAEVTEREADHGAWASPVYLSERPITLAGTVEAPDKTTLDDALERLRAAVSLTDTTLTVYESVPKQATVRRSGKPLLSYITDRVATWSVMVTAPDPRRYDVTLQSGTTMLPSTTGGLILPISLPLTIASTTVAGQINATNTGTFPTRPLLTITGPVTAPQILAQQPDGTVRFLNYSQDLAVGDQLVIDTDAHTVTLNGNVGRRRFLTVPTGWPEIPAGGTVSLQFRSSAYNPTATLTATWRSAWI
jgi:hypothetical protein